MARHLLPRQTPLTSLFTALSSIPVDANTQTSGSTPAPSPSSTTDTQSSTTQPHQLTEPSSSTETSSSTLQSTSTAPSTANDHTTRTTSSHTTPSSSSPSTPPGTRSSLTSTSPVPPSSTTQPPSPSSSLHGILTTITSSYTIYVSGSPSVTETAIPTTISESTTSSSSERSAIIGGSAAGGAALIILILTFAFCVRRRRFKQLDFLDRITRKQNQAYTRANLLDADDDVNLTRPPLAAPPQRGHTGYDTPWDAPTGADSPLTSTSTPMHEHVQLIDTLTTTRSEEAETDLGRIVDDVMGPPSYATVEAEAHNHFSAQSVSSMYRGSMAETDGQVHSRTVSNASNAALLEAAGLGGTGTVRSSPLAQPVSRKGGNTS